MHQGISCAALKIAEQRHDTLRGLSTKLKALIVVKICFQSAHQHGSRVNEACACFTERESHRISLLVSVGLLTPSKKPRCQVRLC